MRKLSDDATKLRDELQRAGSVYTEKFDALSPEEQDHAAELVSTANVHWAVAGFISYYFGGQGNA